MRMRIIMGLVLCFASSVCAQTSLQTQLDAVWEQTKLDAFTNAPNVREYAGYITLNTANGAYGITNVTPGAWCSPTQKVSMKLPSVPTDIFENSSPTSTAIYVVGWFHTHIPIFAWTNYFPSNAGRDVGPSRPADYDAAINPLINMPGFSYDYEEDLKMPGRIPVGHPLHAPAKLYPITPPERRQRQ